MLGLKLRGGEEARQPLPVDDESALVGLFDDQLELQFVFDRLLGLGPQHGLARLFEGELDVAVFGDGRDDLGLDDVADVGALDNLARVHVLPAVYHAGAEGRQVDVEACAVQRDDRALDNIALFGRLLRARQKTRHQRLDRFDFAHGK